MKCKICKSENTETIILKEMMFGTGEEFTYFQCKSCGCLQLENYPDNIGDYYAQDYYTNKKPFRSISTSKRLLLKIRMFLVLSNLSFIVPSNYFNNIMRWAKTTGLDFKSKILDVGCGNGDLLYSFNKNGFKNLYGIDPFLEKSKSVQNIKLFKKEIFVVDNRFDLIIFNHSFEHIWEQKRTIDKAKELLNQNGIIIIRIPILNEAFRIYQENWIQLDPPRHFFLHSRKSILLLLENFDFELISEEYDSTILQFLGSEQAKKGIPLYGSGSYKSDMAKSIFTKDDLKVFSKKTNRLNQQGKGDQATFIFKKRAK